LKNEKETKSMRQLLLPQIVRKSNALARAKIDPQSTLEQRLVALVASRIHPDDVDMQLYRIPIKELMRDNDYTGGEKKKRLEELAAKMVTTGVRLLDDDGKEGHCSLFSWCKVIPGATFEVQFHPKLKPHFLDLKKTLFTQYNLLEFLSLGSTYSQRLFEILKSWDDKPEVTFSIDDFQERLAIPASLAKNFKDFRRRVLEPAHAEISQKTSLKFEWSPVRLQVSKKDEPVRWGRKVVGVRFVFSPARVAETTAKKEKEDTTAQMTKGHLKNMALFDKVKQCWSKKGGDCREDLSKALCEQCHEWFPRQLKLTPEKA
jgi:plasmid replication initiation protein